MKLNFHLFLAAVIIAGGPFRMAAQDNRPGFAREPGIRDRDDDTSRAAPLGTLEKASRLLGMEIRDRGNRRLATVRDIAIDLDNDRIVEVIATSGGSAGRSARAVALPPQLFSLEADRTILVLNMEQRQFRDLPEFELSKWEQNVVDSRVKEVYQRHEIQPYFVVDVPAGRLEVSPRGREQFENVGGKQMRSLGHVERLSRVLGMSARNLIDEPLGKVDNVILDLPAGRVVEVILATGGYLGMRDELSVVPPSAFHFDARQRVLRLDTTKASLARAPHFKSREWPDVNRPEFVVGVYRAYSVEPYFNAPPANPARDTANPAVPGDSRADMEITRAIRRQIMERRDLSENAQNVTIITRDGRVTLRGPVNSEAERRAIIEIARSAMASPAGLDDRLEVPEPGRKPDFGR